DQLIVAPGARPAGRWSGTRGTALLLNNVLLVGLAVTVLVGTLVPVASAVLGDGQVAVGAPYYDRIAVPVGLGLLALVVLGTVGRWRPDAEGALLQRGSLPLAAVAVVVAALGLSGARGIAAVLALGLAAGVATASLAAMSPELRGRRHRALRQAPRR